MENMNENNTNENNACEDVTNNEVTEDIKPWKKGWLKELIDWITAILIAAVVAFVLKSFVLTLAVVNGHSMDNTLAHGDRLYVNKLFYEPEKGDIVIIETDKHPDGALVKRVIATEGDTIYIDPDTFEVYLNDKLLEESYIKGKTTLPAVKDANYGLIVQYSGELAETFADPQYSREHPIVVGKDQVFVMGDNRENSSDSRYMGLFSTDEVTGHAVFRFWPLNSIKKLD